MVLALVLSSGVFLVATGQVGCLRDQSGNRPQETGYPPDNLYQEKGQMDYPASGYLPPPDNAPRSSNICENDPCQQNSAVPMEYQGDQSGYLAPPEKEPLDYPPGYPAPQERTPRSPHVRDNDSCQQGSVMPVGQQGDQPGYRPWERAPRSYQVHESQHEHYPQDNALCKNRYYYHPRPQYPARCYPPIPFYCQLPPHVCPIGPPPYYPYPPCSSHIHPNSIHHHAHKPSKYPPPKHGHHHSVDTIITDLNGPCYTPNVAQTAPEIQPTGEAQVQLGASQQDAKQEATQQATKEAEQDDTKLGAARKPIVSPFSASSPNIEKTGSAAASKRSPVTEEVHQPTADSNQEASEEYSAEIYD